LKAAAKNIEKRYFSRTDAKEVVKHQFERRNHSKAHSNSAVDFTSCLRTAPHREEATFSKASITTENAGNDESKFAPLSREINEVKMKTVSMSMASLCFS